MCKTKRGKGMLSYKINVKRAVCRKLITKNTYVVLIPKGQSKCNFRKISWTRFNDGNIHKITNRNTRFTNETDTFFNSGLQTPTIGESDVVETGCRISKSRITIVLVLQHSRLYRRVDITHLFYSISLVLMIYSADFQTLFFF